LFPERKKWKKWKKMGWGKSLLFDFWEKEKKIKDKMKEKKDEK